MNEYETVRQVFLSQDGIARTADITSRGIHHRYIHELRKNGTVARIKRGLSEWVADGGHDDLHVLFAAIPEAVLCMYSALYYYGYTDRTPAVWHIAVSKDTNKKKLKLEYPPLKAYYIEPHYVTIGVIEAEIDSTKVRIYDREKTICDVLRYSAKMDKEVFNKAIMGYVQDPRKDINRLANYAQLLGVHKKMNDLIGPWL